MWTNPGRDKPRYERVVYVKLMYRQKIKKYLHVIEHIAAWWRHMAVEICVKIDYAV